MMICFILILSFINFYYMTNTVRNLIKIQKESRTVGMEIKFSSIKEIRPKESSHIFVWDAVEKIAFPLVYSGNEEAWKNMKDKEERYTHFIELDCPK